MKAFRVAIAFPGVNPELISLPLLSVHWLPLKQLRFLADKKKQHIFILKKGDVIKPILSNDISAVLVVKYIVARIMELYLISDAGNGLPSFSKVKIVRDRAERCRTSFLTAHAQKAVLYT